jgi:hypothetical protein
MWRVPQTVQDILQIQIKTSWFWIQCLMFTVGGHCLHLAVAANSAGHLANSDKNKLILNPMPHVHSWESLLTFGGFRKQCRRSCRFGGRYRCTSTPSDHGSPRKKLYSFGSFFI